MHISFVGRFTGASVVGNAVLCEYTAITILQCRVGLSNIGGLEGVGRHMSIHMMCLVDSFVCDWHECNAFVNT